MGILRMSTKPLPHYVTFRLNFPSGSQQTPSTDEASPLVEYTEESNDHQEISKLLPVTNRKWNNFTVNLNGDVKKAAVVPDKDIEKSPLLPYSVAPSFEMRWPQNGGVKNGVAPQAFQLTSHKQLDPISDHTNAEHVEGIMEESDESPPYLPAASAPSPSIM